MSTQRSPLTAELTAIESAIVQTVAYADVFDYPLTDGEIHRYLVQVPASLETVRRLLTGGTLVEQWLQRTEGYYTLPGRQDLVPLRRQRTEAAHTLWPHALHYGRAIARLPFVRMVAVTGALAVNNVEPDADIDYLVVTETGRLWTCRALVILGVVRVAAGRGHLVCPNYFVSEDALHFTDQTLYVAHEIAQMVPIAGLATYHRLRLLNQPWTAALLPNAADAPRSTPPEPSRSQLGYLLGELTLRTPIGAWLERWEMKRKVRRLSREADGSAETHFSADWCKGHFGGYGRRTLNAYDQRLDTLQEQRP